jgi:outer membrane protein OmpA-like peptidoglycan-associated protein
MSSWSLIYLVGSLTLSAQTPVAPAASVPLYRVTIEQSSAKAINYRYLKSSTKVDFKGTALAPAASGMAKVTSEATTTAIHAKFKGLPEASQFGSEYLTYVLWAISPEGRASNLGEILLKHGKGTVKVTEPLQSFGLVVTAEPYFAVTQPSNVVVLENAVRKGTEGKVELIDAKFDLLKRGTYHTDANPAEAMARDKNTPFEVYEARNAVAIALAEGAKTYAPEPFAKAQGQLAKSEAPAGNPKEMAMAAREAVQSAEDARLIAVKRQETEALDNERRLAQAKIDEAKTAAALAASAEASANQSKQAAMAENSNLKDQLREQLNAVLQTRATARGLIVNMSGMTFKTGQAALLPAGREKLAKIAGLILAHPGLKLAVEGYTDSTGTDQINQRLSERRAESARDFLVAQGVSQNAIVSRGLGKANPIASNATMEGRQDNRRVELVVSGAGITDSSTGLEPETNNK